MTHLTYWYGEFNDIRNAYSFQKTSSLLSYEKGMKTKKNNLTILKKKRDEGKKLLVKELKLVKGNEEMELDRIKDPTERSGYVDSNFLEEYHVLLEEEEEIKEDKPKNQKSKTKTKTASDSKNAKKKKNKIKVTKGSIQTDKQTTTDLGTVAVVENGETPKPKKKNSKKRVKKGDSSIETPRPKKKIKKSKKVEVDDQDLKVPRKSTIKDIEEENGIHRKDDMTGSAKGVHDTIGGSAKVEDKKPSVYEEFAALDDVSSHGDTDDVSVELDDFKSEDSADEDYIEKPKSKAPGKKTAKNKLKTLKRPAKSKEPPKKKGQKTKINVEISTVKEEKNAAVNLTLKKLLKKEQRKFHTCEVEYLPLLRRWEKALGDKNVTQLTRIYEKLLTSMEYFTAPFILEYGMNDLMKRSKGYNNELRKQVLIRFKKIYVKKKDEVPEGFKPIKESEKYVPVPVDVDVDVETERASEKAEPAKASKLSKDKQSSKDVDSTMDVSDTPQDTPIPKVPLSSSKSRTSESNGEITPQVKPEPSSQKPKKPEIKPEPTSLKQNISGGKQEKKKRFSLGNLMRTGSASQLNNAVTKQLSSLGSSSGLTSRSSKNNQSNPSWTMQVVSNEKISNKNRIFGLEFLQQAALYIPESTTMNYEAVARNIEIAIFNWSTTGNSLGASSKKHDDKERWNKYWNKIHDLAACISGKRQTGTLAKMIRDGKFATPDELVGLHDDDLWCSFEGSPLSKFGN